MTELVSLRQYVEENGPLPVKSAIGWIGRAARTLERIHNKDHVYGSMCAEAIMLAEEDCESEGSLLHPINLHDDVAYQSPAVEAGDDPTAADDIWSLCVTLYFALTGALPFPRGVAAAVDAGTTKAAPLAVHQQDLDGFQGIMDELLDPLAEPRSVVKARLLVLHLGAFAPTTKGLPRLRLEQPKIAPPPRMPKDFKIPEMDVTIVEEDTSDPSAPVPPELLRSLPPAPPSDVPHSLARGRHGWPTRYGPWLVPFLCLVIIVLAAVIVYQRAGG